MSSSGRVKVFYLYQYEYYGHIHACSPWGRGRWTLHCVNFFFRLTTFLWPLLSFAYFVQILSSQWYFNRFSSFKRKGDLRSQGHHRLMIYVHIVVLSSPNPSFVKIIPPNLVWAIFNQSCDLDYLYIHPFLQRLHIKSGFDWTSGFRVWILG